MASFEQVEAFPDQDPKVYMRRQDDADSAHAVFAAACVVTCTEEGARQEFGPESDINALVERMLRGEVVANRGGSFGEVDFDFDYQAAQDVIRQARDAYDRLPLGLRRQFPTWQALAAYLQAHPELGNTPASTEGLRPEGEAGGPPAGDVPAPSASPSA